MRDQAVYRLAIGKFEQHAKTISNEGMEIMKNVDRTSLSIYIRPFSHPTLLNPLKLRVDSL
jgi:hypothetical protein